LNKQPSIDEILLAKTAYSSSLMLETQFFRFASGYENQFSQCQVIFISSNEHSCLRVLDEKSVYLQLNWIVAGMSISIDSGSVFLVCFLPS